MPIYAGRRKGTHRVTVWAQKKQHEEIFEGSKTDARAREARMRLDLKAESTRRKARAAPSVSVFCVEEYQPHAEARIGARTWRRTRSYIVNELCEFFGEYRLDQLTTPLVDAYVAVRSKSLAASTLNAELNILRHILTVAESLGHEVPDLKIPRLREVRQRVHAWSSSELARLLAATRKADRRLLPMILFLVNTGCRKGECVAARWSWVDRRRGLLSIGASNNWAPKSKRPREIPISDALAAVLDRLPELGPFLFPNLVGEPYIEFPNRAFRDIVKSAKLKGGPHTCRHTFASMFLGNGGSLWELSALLGHTLSRTTELYAHMLPEHLEQTRNVVSVDDRGRNPGARPWRARASA